MAREGLETKLGFYRTVVFPNKEGIIFFCPSNYAIEKDEYWSSLDGIKKSSRIDSTISVIGISYRNMNASIENPKIDSLQISELDCFLILNDSINLSRAARIDNNFYYFTEGLPEGIYGVKIRDGVVCPKNLAAKIQVYYDFLFEVFSPKYSTKEQFQMLEEKLHLQNEHYLKEMNELKKTIEQLNGRITELDNKKRDKK